MPLTSLTPAPASNGTTRGGSLNRPNASRDPRCKPAGLPAPLLALALGVVLALALAACQRPPADDAGRRQQAYALYDGYRQQLPQVADIAPAEALALPAGEAVFVDARTDAARAVSSLPAAVTEAAFLADPARFAGKKVIVYCTIGYRSGLVTRTLAQQGIPALNMAAGILGWLHAGGPLVDATGQPTKRVHVYGRTWDLAPLAYTAVW